MIPFASRRRGLAAGGPGFLLLALLILVWAAPLVAQDEDDDGIEADDGLLVEDEDAPEDERFALAKRHHEMGRFAEAFALYDEIMKERGEDVATLTTYGHMHWKIGEYGAAEQRLKRAIELNPKHIKARQFLGQMYFHQGRRSDARQAFDDLLKLDWIRDVVRNSAHLNLGKIDLLDEKWRDAREHFQFIAKNGDKAYRRSGKSGNGRVRVALELDEWGRHRGERITVHFSPQIPELSTPEARKSYVEPLDAFIRSAASTLGVVTPEPWHLYVFLDDGEASGLTGHRSAYNWDYSWWSSNTAYNNKLGPKHALAAQFAARWGGSRPLSRALVEGLAAHLAGEVADPHARARERLAADQLFTLEELQRSMRNVDEHESFTQYDHGTSYVRYLIDTYGLERFGRMYRHFNVTVNAPQYKPDRTTAIDWQRAYDDLFLEAFGVTEADAQAGWRAFLAR